MVIAGRLLVSAVVWSQDSLPNCVSGAFNDNGPIVLARIDSVQPSTEGQPSTATLTVLEYLRGGGVRNDVIEVQVDWNGDLRFALRPPVWYKIAPEVGKLLLIVSRAASSKSFRHLRGGLEPRCDRTVTRDEASRRSEQAFTREG